MSGRTRLQRSRKSGDQLVKLVNTSTVSLGAVLDAEDAQDLAGLREKDSIVGAQSELARVSALQLLDVTLTAIREAEKV